MQVYNSLLYRGTIEMPNIFFFSLIPSCVEMFNQVAITLPDVTFLKLEPNLPCKKTSVVAEIVNILFDENN